MVISRAGALALPALDARVPGQVLTPKSPECGGETEILDYSSNSTELVLAKCGPYPQGGSILLCKNRQMKFDG